MSLEQLEQAKITLNFQLQQLKSESTNSLEEGANYKFVLCTAKISFIESILDDVNRALAGSVPSIIVQSTLLAVEHLEQNFQQFLGTCSSCKGE